ncbi:MAG: HAMP domain-containing sensor histidine kinase [Bacteroidales bacterium]|nr:HAMP domain-containing sensor histidine kinase [Bacteroidales bacterium]MDY6427526.1 HAMP domain-containing sensor histidine kinase [Bacteroidales bacterium]
MEKFKVLFRPLLAIIGLIIIVASFLFTRDVVVSLAMEEYGKMKLWAAATEQLIRADMQCDVTLEQGVITNNTTIPVILTDSLFNVLSYKNIDIKNPTQEELKVLAVKYSQQHEPIKVDVGDDVQLICYGNSILYKKLFLFPIVQFFVIGLFVVLIILAIKLMKSSEQNKVWVGLSKETAHQLGTPISSLMAWIEIMKSKYPDDDMFLEMDKDVIRLRTVAERFSQIGSTTELKKSCVNDVIERQVEYIRTRFSTKVEMLFKSDGEYMAMLNVPLFEWVIENLCKNSVDAMEGKGHIDITMSGTDTHVLIDVKDDGKGIGIKNKNMVFSPGYTTKKRGWGLGLSLVKRIVEEYHKGRIYVLSSHVGVGTTFRIELKRIVS